MSRPNPLPLGLISTLVVVALAFGVAGCGSQTAPTSPKATTVEVAQISSVDDAATIKATGTVSRSREAALSFRIAGVMSRLAVDAGDRVRAGQIIAQIDARDAQARTSQTQAELALATRDFARLKGLVDAGAISRQQYDAARTRVSTAKAAYQAAAFDSQSAQLVSPVSGVVLTRAAQSGEVVQPGQPIITVADQSSPLVLRVPVADRDVDRINIGSEATIEADALGPQRLTGRVSRIGQQAGSQSGAIEVEITLPASSGLRSGMVASARIALSPPPTAVRYARIPAEAILEANGPRAFVMRYDARAGRARRTAVAFGGFSGDDALVAGIPDGAQVITGGAGYVANGDRVTISVAAK